MEVECLALKDLTSPRKGFPEEEEEEEEGGKSEQKENICTERRRSTPLKSAESPFSSVLLINTKGATPDMTHITPIKHTALAEPWTPTANLKMLISAASPDIRDREMKKVLFRPIENEKDTPEVGDAGQFEAADEEDDVDKKPSRKQKSLGLLCQKFLALYPDYPPAHIWISLDEVATSLGVERRRIYDIVNVLESLMIVGRIAKNSYTWYGRLRLEATLEELQRKGRQQGYHLHMDLASEAKEAGPGREDDGAEGDSGNASGNRKDKSLRIMSQKFVMLFLVSKTQTVTLDAAAKILIEESQDSSSHSKYKTKVRRLYDIANVLTSLGLIKKVHVREERGRKPAFKWLGPVEFSGSSVNTAAVPLPEAAQPITGQEPRRAKMARHASFDITATSVAERRLVSSAPSSPRRDAPGPNQPLDYSKKTESSKAVCRLRFGNAADLPGSAHPALLTPPLFPSSSPHCLAYLPSLSQPSVVMLYRAEGQRSPRLESEEGRKRKRDEREEEEGAGLKKKGPLEQCGEIGAEAASQTGSVRTMEEGRGGGEPIQASHYLYVPNSAAPGVSFLLSSQPPAGRPLPSSGVPTLALPYVLVPSAALSHYPLVTGGLQQHGPEAHGELSFSLPAHFMVGAAPCGVASAADISGSPGPSPSTPEQRLCGSAAPQTPQTPKETTKAFFQTPGPLGNVVSSAPAPRKRGSAQRRLDIGHQPTS